MSCRLVSAIIAAVFLFSTQAKPQPDRSGDIVEKTIAVVKEACLVGMENTYQGSAQAHVTLLKLTPGGGIGGKLGKKQIVGAIDIDDPQARITADENIRNCIKPYMPLIISYITGTPSQPASPSPAATPPRKPKAKLRALPQSAAADPPFPSEQLTAKFECYQFYANRNLANWQFTEAQTSDAVALLQRATSSDDLRDKLDQSRVAMANDPAFKALDESDQWRVVLRKHCELLNRALPDPRQALLRFRSLLIDTYFFEINAKPGAKNELSVSDSTVRMWLLWTTYNNHFYDSTIFEAMIFDDKYGRAAEEVQKTVGFVALPAPGDQAAVQLIFHNGPLNDIAAARWLQAKSECALHRDAHRTFEKLSRVSSGLIYDLSGFFWRPSDQHDCH